MANQPSYSELPPSLSMQRINTAIFSLLNRECDIESGPLATALRTRQFPRETETPARRTLRQEPRGFARFVGRHCPNVGADPWMRRVSPPIPANVSVRIFLASPIDRCISSLAERQPPSPSSSSCAAHVSGRSMSSSRLRVSRGGALPSVMASMMFGPAPMGRLTIHLLRCSARPAPPSPRHNSCIAIRAARSC